MLKGWADDAVAIIMLLIIKLIQHSGHGTLSKIKFLTHTRCNMQTETETVPTINHRIAQTDTLFFRTCINGFLLFYVCYSFPSDRRLQIDNRNQSHKIFFLKPVQD